MIFKNEAMARKDEIFKSFMCHELLISKYKLNMVDIPTTVRDALNSDKPIIKAIALIVEGSEGSSPLTDNALRAQITQYLNSEAL